MRIWIVLLCLAIGGLSASAGHAAEARVGVKPKHGEMVLLRDVNARPAYRKVPPSFALIVDPTPNDQLQGVLGQGEMSDDDFAALSSGKSLATMAAQTASIDARLSSAGLGGNGQGRVVGGSGGALGGVLGGVGGMVGGSTRGINSAVSGALSQLPLGNRSGGGGP